MGNPISIQLLTGTTPTWDALYKFAKITASANVAITISGAGTPDGGVLHFKQDGTGSRTLSINGTPITVNTAAGSLTQIQWSYDGEDYLYHTNVQGGASGSVVQLSAPTLSATAVSSSAIDVVVGTVTGAASYEVYESPDNATWTLIGTTAGTYNRTGKTAEAQYYYRAKAIGDGTTYSDSAYATANATTQAAGGPLGPEIFINSSFTDPLTTEDLGWDTWSDQDSWTLSGGQATRNGAGGTDILEQTITVETGIEYELTFDFDAATHSNAKIAISSAGSAATFTYTDGLEGTINAAVNKANPTRRFTVNVATFTIWLWAQQDTPCILNSVSLKKVL